MAQMMHVAFLNPQGNFDPADRYWTEHPDFGGQLVYVKEVALALGALGHRVDILTRRIVDPGWEGFEETLDAYPGHPNVRIVRLDCGPAGFLRKELLWPHLHEWTGHILAFYGSPENLPDVWTGHYADGGLTAALLSAASGRPFTFTGHSLGAQKLERLAGKPEDWPALNDEYHFGARILAERTAMSRAGCIIVSTQQEQREQYTHPLYRRAVDSQDADRFAIVPPGVNLHIFDRSAAAPEQAAVEAKIEAALARDLAPGRGALPCVLASSRLEPKKNHLGLVRAYALSPELQQTANLALVVRGLPGALRSTSLEETALPVEARAILAEIAGLAEAHSLWGKLITVSLDSQVELASGYRYLAQRRSVFCLPAHHEPFGLAPLEAMAAGLPVVATRFGGPAESMADEQGQYGVLVDPNDAQELAAALLQLTGNPAIWQRYREAGYGRVLARYTWERTAEGYARVCAALGCRPLYAEGLAVPSYFTRLGEPEPSIAELMP